jgi:PAS domain S-box-containing protein
MLIFVYFVIGIYHIVLYVYNRDERYNLFFGLVGVLYFFYIFFRSGLVNEIITYTPLVTRGELVSLYAVIPCFGAFVDLITNKRVSRFTYVYAAFSGLLILLSLPFSEAFALDILVFWQATAIVPAGYYMFFVIGKPVAGDIRRHLAGGYSVLNSVWLSLSRTVAGNLVIGMAVVIACMVFDIFDAVYLSLGISTSKYGFFVLMMGIALVLANRFLYIYKKVESLNEDLEKKIDDINEANRTITVSEEKYRLIVEGANEVIFLLDEKLCFKTVNKTARVKLGMSPDEMKGMNFMDFLNRGAGDRSVDLQFVNEKLNTLKVERRPVSFKIEYRMPQTLENTELQVRLENINLQESSEVLGKISRVAADTLLPYFKSERISYSIKNQLSTAEEISYRITRNTQRFMDQKDSAMLRIAVREVIINAIEHGNLGITFEEKTGALDSDSYFELIASRQEEEAYGNRTVDIDYRITSERAEYRVTDHGEGFDHVKFLSEMEKANEQALSHGRGIMMAYSTFDEISFNRKGNQVLLVKKFK